MGCFKPSLRAQSTIGRGNLSISARERFRLPQRLRRLAMTHGVSFTLLFIWAFTAPLTIAAAEPLKIVALGDSLTEGYHLPKSQSYPAQLQAMLREAGVAVVIENHGISGDTTAGGRARLPKVLAAEPDMVIVALGANDFLRGIPPAAARANLQAIVKELTDQHIPTLLIGIQVPSNLGPAYKQQFDAIFTDLAARYPVTLHYDFLKNVAGKASLNLSDGMHPNEAGYKIVAQNLLPVVQQMLQKIAAR